MDCQLLLNLPIASEVQDAAALPFMKKLAVTKRDYCLGFLLPKSFLLFVLQCPVDISSKVLFFLSVGQVFQSFVTEQSFCHLMRCLLFIGKYFFTATEVHLLSVIKL